MKQFTPILAVLMACGSSIPSDFEGTFESTGMYKLEQNGLFYQYTYLNGKLLLQNNQGHLIIPDTSCDDLQLYIANDYELSVKGTDCVSEVIDISSGQKGLLRSSRDGVMKFTESRKEANLFVNGNVTLVYPDKKYDNIKYILELFCVRVEYNEN